MLHYTYTKKNQTLAVRKPNKALRWLFVTFSVLIIATVATQLYVMSVYAVKGEEVAKLEKKKEVLEKQNKLLSDEIADSRSIEYIRERSQHMGFVDIDHDNVKYIEIED